MNIFRTSSTVRTTMVVRLTPGESRRLSAFLDQKVAISVTKLSHTGHGHTVTKLSHT